MRPQEGWLFDEFVFLRRAFSRCAYVDSNNMLRDYQEEIESLEKLETIVELAKEKLKEYHKELKELIRFGLRIEENFHLIAIANFYKGSLRHKYDRKLTLDEVMSFSIRDSIDEAISHFLRFCEIEDLSLILSLRFPFLSVYKSLCSSGNYNCYALIPDTSQLFHISAEFLVDKNLLVF